MVDKCSFQPLPLSPMIPTVISGTARNDSNSLKIARLYQRLMSERLGKEVDLLSLHDVNVWERGVEMLLLERHLLVPATHFIFVIPEYNGSFPGILKTMIDNSDIKSCWWGKKALLTGIAEGRAGNLRGMDHMSTILQYLRMDVYWDKLPLSRISDELDGDGNLLMSGTRELINAQISGFLSN